MSTTAENINDVKIFDAEFSQYSDPGFGSKCKQLYEAAKTAVLTCDKIVSLLVPAEAKLTDAIDRLNPLTQQLKDIQEFIEKDNRVIEQCDKSISVAQDMLHDPNTILPSQIKSLQDSIKQTQAQRAAFQAELQPMIDKLTEIKPQIDQLKIDIKAAKADLDELNAKLDDSLKATTRDALDHLKACVDEQSKATTGTTKTTTTTTGSTNSSGSTSSSGSANSGTTNTGTNAGPNFSGIYGTGNAPTGS